MRTAEMGRVAAPTTGERARDALIRLLNMQEGGLLLFLIVMSVGVYLDNHIFFSERNMMNILRQVSMMGIAGVGMSVLLIGGEVDLSIGSVQAAVGVLVMQVMNQTGSMWAGIAVGLAFGVVVGLVNAFVVLKLKVNSLIATLATMSLVRSFVYLYHQAAVQNKWKFGIFQQLGNGYIWKIPYPVLYMIVIFVVFYLVLTRTSFGRYIYAMGGNPRAVALSGVRVQWLKMWAFVICSTLSAVAAIILVSRMNSGQPNAGAGFEMTVVGAVILGGCSLAGGEGNLLGTLLGVLIMGVVNNAVVLLNMDLNWQRFFMGVVILLAVFIDTQRRKRGQIRAATAARGLSVDAVNERTKPAVEG